MFYIEMNQPHVVLLPTVAIGLDSEFWVGICWLNLEFGWRSGDGGEGDFEGVTQ